MYRVKKEEVAWPQRRRKLYSKHVGKPPVQFGDHFTKSGTYRSAVSVMATVGVL